MSLDHVDQPEQTQHATQVFQHQQRRDCIGVLFAIYSNSNGTNYDGV